jgi:hypothetical protein
MSVIKLETYSELLLLVDLGIFETISCRVLLKISTRKKKGKSHRIMFQFTQLLWEETTK